MLQYDSRQQMDIAVANLSQLTYFVAPLSGSVSLTLPEGNTSRFALEESLRVIGINLHDPDEQDVMVEGATAGPLSDHVVELAHGKSLLFSMSGLQKLLDAGVSTESLSIVRKRLDSYSSQSAAAASMGDGQAYVVRKLFPNVRS